MRSLFRSPALWAMSASILIQQSLVALSLVALTHAATAVTEGAAWHRWLGLYVACLVLPYITLVLTPVFLRRWTLDAVRAFLDAGAAACADRPTLHPEARRRETMEAIYARTGPEAVAGATAYVEQLLSSALNSLLSALAVAWVLDPSFLAVYAVGVAGNVLLIRRLARPVGRAARRAESARVALVAVLGRVWDNVVLGNGHCRRLWDTRRLHGWRRWKRTAMRAEVRQQSGSLALAVMSLAPAIALLLGLAWSRRDDAAAVAVLLVTAPRMFQLLASLNDLMWLALGWNAVRARLDVAGTVLVPTPAPDLWARVRPDRLRIDGVPTPMDREGLASWLAALPRTGRITIRGDNGAGKSSLLLLVKATSVRTCFILPARHGLDFAGSSALSTGQRTLRLLDEIEREVDVSVLLLDEWDAHLDQANRAALSARLDAMARTRLIVEVRHRAGDAGSGSAAA